jgi:hypothetical protein
MREKLARLLVLALAVWLDTFALAGNEDHISRDPSTGDYNLTYPGYDTTGSITTIRVTFVPATKIDPRITSSIHYETGGIVVYRYRIVNDKNSKQPLIAFRLDPVLRSFPR